MITRPNTVFALLLAAFLLAGPGSAVAKRVALVVGNSAYAHSTVLDNPANDARAIAGALERHGFETITGIDLNHAGMLKTIRDFSRKLQGAKVAVFFYAGHGIQVSNRNYLVPVDAKLKDSFGIDFELVRLERIHRMMEEQAKVNLVFLDACRNNPLSRNLARSMGTRSASIGDGLAPMESGVGSLISFSTQPGNVALDGRGQQNSPYSTSLAKHIGEGKGDITEILIKVRRDVMLATSQQQIPWEHSALTQQFYFEKSTGSKPTAQPPETAPAASAQAEMLFWETVKDTNDKALLGAYLDRYPNGAFAILAKAMVAKLDTSAPPKPATPIAKTEKPKTDASPRRQQLAARQPADETTRQTRATTLPPVARIDPVEASRTEAAREQERVALIKRVQSHLKDLQCYRGTVDGDWGPASRRALKAAFAGRLEDRFEDMSDVNVTTADTLIAALPNDARENCAAAARATAKAVPRLQKPNRTTKRRTTSRTTTRRQTTARRKAPPRRAAKRCRSKMNPERFTDDKAPMMITVCE